VSTDSTAANPSSLPADDPYADRPSFLRRHADVFWALGVFVATVVLTVVSFPPMKAPEFAYALAVPAIFWSYLRPRFRLFVGTMFAAQAVAWTILLGWLHHVTIGGLILLGPFVGAWVGLWYLAVWWTMPRLLGREPGVRVLAVFGLAALWVIIEWSRTWLLSGFPWLPLSASQWQRPILLQVAAYTGAYGVSFILILFNLGIAAYAHRLLREKEIGLRKRSPEFMAALLVLMFPSFLLLGEIFGQQRQAVARVAVVQPYIPQTVKWDPAKGPGILEILETLTTNAALSRTDLILWPEAVTPWAVRGDVNARAFVEHLSHQVRTPILFGSIAIEDRGGPDEAWYNGAFVVTPDFGLQPIYYAKRHLVPFGEYVPLRPVLGWISKFVEIGDDFTAGDDSRPLVVSLPSGPTVVGPLICYEDIYPRLAASSALAGAELLVVMTNNGWFGEGGAAHQHAAHSVLRAIETRRPVIRVGNGGWSGWIDEYGNIRASVTNDEGSVYFRGARSLAITRDARWVNRNSHYAEHGDWFIVLAAALVLLGLAVVKMGKPAAPKPADV